MKDLSESRILIVDDAKTNIDILVEALRDEYKLSVALDGAAALRSVEKSAPDLVLLPADADDVREAVRFAAGRGLPLAVRSGGHGPSTNDGGIVIDLGLLRDVQVLDAERDQGDPLLHGPDLTTRSC